MGDVADANDIDRFLRSTEGKEELEVRVQALVGRSITKVSFENHTYRIGILLHLSDGTYYTVYEEALELDDIQCNFEEVLEREYLKDLPNNPG